MFHAKIDLTHTSIGVTLGPTDTRDEAARLARSWMDAYRGERAERNPVAGVRIERVEDDAR